jgi:hypothetical protein
MGEWPKPKTDTTAIERIILNFCCMFLIILCAATSIVCFQQGLLSGIVSFAGGIILSIAWAHWRASGQPLP